MAWDYGKTEYDKQAKNDPVWHLERLINYGLNGEKLKKDDLIRHFKDLKISDDKRAFFELILWNKRF